MKKEPLMINKKGFISVILFFLMIAVSFAVVPVLKNMRDVFNVSVNQRENERAFFIADSGIRAYSQLLKSDYDWTNNVGLTKSFGTGTFVVAITGPAPREIARIFITSTGRVTVGAANFTRVIGEILYSSRGAFNGRSSIFGAGPATISGNNKVTIGDATHPGDIYIGGTLSEINNGSVTIYGQTLTSQPAVRLPTVNWSYWQAQAQSSGSGHVITGDTTFSAPYTGVYYVNGNVIVQNMNNKTCNGTIIATGNITIQNNSGLTVNVAAGNPSFVSGATVNVLNNNNPTIGGSIYAANNMLLQGDSNALIYGSLVYGGQFDLINNNKPVTINPSLGSGGSGDGGPGFGGGGDTVAITSFREI